MIFFIINQNANLGKAHLIFEKRVKPILDKKRVQFDYVVTKTTTETIKQTKQAVEKYQIIVAGGGDGTINAVGKSILGSKAIMGILPLGSANNLAWHSLAIPHCPQKATEILLQKKVIKMDVGIINQAVFFNVIGIGLNGQIAELGHRHWFYRRLGPPELRYGLPLLEKLGLIKPFKLTIKTKNQVFQKTSILTTIYNGKKEANAFPFNQKGSINDGLLDIVVIEDTPFIERAKLLFEVLTSKTKKSLKQIHFFQAQAVQLDLSNNLKKNFPLFHIDGEPIGSDENSTELESKKILDIKILPQSLSIITG